MEELIKMLRDEPLQSGGPIKADVHPDEVENWAEMGWRIAPTNTTESKDHAQQGGTSGDLGESAQTGEDAGAGKLDGDGQDALPPEANRADNAVDTSTLDGDGQEASADDVGKPGEDGPESLSSGPNGEQIDGGTGNLPKAKVTKPKKAGA